MEGRRVRIQPRDLCIPEEDPFGPDRLRRKESAEVLTRIVSRVEGPCVLALDAPWGYGKTTFLKMWEAWLRQEAQGFPVVACFNAWETDFTNHPFLALSSELTKELESCIETTPLPGFNTFKRAGKKLLQVAPQLAGSLVPGGGAAVEAVLSVLSAAASDKADTNDYLETKEAIAEFKKALKKLAQGLEKPLVVMIDELDRCRPSYAVALLEVAKHLFAVDNVVFVLAVNRAELAHSVKALYGSGFDAEGYLRRFFDLDFQLPEPSREQFVQDLLTKTRLATILDPRIGPDHLDEVKTARALLDAFIGSSDLSLRRVQQAVHRLGTVLDLLPSDAAPLALYAVIAIVLRTVDFAVYQRFVAGEVPAEEVAEVVFRWEGSKSLRLDDHGIRIESHIILSSLDTEIDPEARGQDFSELKSPLLNRYRELKELGPPNDADVKHAESILRCTQLLRQTTWLDSAPLRQTFLASIRRLELRSPELGEDRGI